jgi:F-type H+-transporting ATPase subunit alpha
MDPVTKMTIDKGLRNTQILIQPQYTPIPVEHQVAVIFCGTNGLLNKVPVDKIPEFEKTFIDVLEATRKESVLNPLKKGIINDEITDILREEAETVANRFIQ